MKYNNQQVRIFILCTFLVLAAVAARIINTETHWYSFAPVMAISLFSGAVLKQKTYAYLLPLAAYFLSDIYIQLFTPYSGFYGISQFFVYAGMVAVTLLGTRMGQPGALKVLGFSICGSLLFWIISNFGVFLGGYWGTGLAGLSKTYFMALPFYTHNGTTFFFNAFAGDLIFSSLLFGAYALGRKMLPAGGAAAAH